MGSELGNAGKVACNSSNTQWRVHCVCRFPVVTLTLACYRLGQSRDSDVVAEDHHMFYKCCFAAVWNSLDVSSSGRLHFSHQSEDGAQAHDFASRFSAGMASLTGCR